LALGVPVAAAARGDTLPTPSIFAPVSTPAFLIRDLSWLVLAICAAIFAVVAYLLIHVIVRFRSPRGADDREPPQIYGSNAIEAAWTVIPILIVVVLFLATARTIFEIDRARGLTEALRVTVVGHQWWWEFRYPDLGIVTANELHLPVSERGERRPTALRLESVDVIHSFWIPQLNGKTDVIPNQPNMMWVEPLQVGTYYGQCAEYCGTQHAHMLLRVVVHPKGEFDAWVAAQRAAPAEVAMAGRAVFMATACVNCHTVRGTPAAGTFGPDLTHLMSRATLGAGVAANTPENLRRWVNDPAHLKPGALMPAMNLSEGEVEAVVAYLTTLK
jgi:cytochrome c oxidase subunit 2